MKSSHSRARSNQETKKLTKKPDPSFCRNNKKVLFQTLDKVICLENELKRTLIPNRSQSKLNYRMASHDKLVKRCHSRGSWNPGTCKCLN